MSENTTTTNALLLSNQEAGFVKRVYNTILKAFEEAGQMTSAVTTNGSYALSDDQLIKIDAYMRRARLAPATCAAKLQELLSRPFFMTMYVINDIDEETGERCNNYCYLTGDNISALGTPSFLPIDRNNPAIMILAASAPNLGADDAERVKGYLRLTGYSYLPIDRYQDMRFSIEACKAIEAAPQGGATLGGNSGESSTMTLHTLKKPDSYFLGNSKPYNLLGLAIPSGEMSGQLQISLYPDRKTKVDVLAYMALTYQGDDIQLSGRKTITGFDKAVYNTVSTLYAKGNTEITAQDIYRTMNGNSKSSPHKAQIERINNSIKKFMYTALYLDISADIQRGGLKLDDDRITSGKIETQLLQATICEVITENKRKAIGYKITREPIMLTYNKAKKHIITVPIGLLDTSEAVSNTEDNIAIREYLLQQIENLKTGHRDNPTIRYAKIYEATGIEPPADRTTARRQRDQIKAMLDIWKARKYITGYKDAKEGNSITGVTIDAEAPKEKAPAQSIEPPPIPKRTKRILYTD